MYAIRSYYAYAYLGGYLIIIMMAPVFAIISEKTEQILSGNSNPFQWAQFFKDIRRGILLALRNLSIEIFVITSYSIHYTKLYELRLAEL